MSTTSHDPGWWQASDGNWYPPTAAPGAMTPPTSPMSTPWPANDPVMCGNCRSPLPIGRLSCPVCRQVQGLPVGATLSSPGKRLGQYLLDALLAFVTLFIGYIIWSLMIWRRGQTPAMQLLHMKVVKTDTRRVATWGAMCLREVLGKDVVMGLISAIFWPVWVVLCFMVVWDNDNQMVWDKVASTIVVENLPDEVAEPDGSTQLGRGE